MARSGRGNNPVSDAPSFQPPYVGSFDHLDCAIGARGMGKSTLQERVALDLQRDSGAYVIGHSLGARLARQLPAELGGDRVPLRYHTSLRSLASGLRWRPASWHILSPPLAGDGNREESQDSADDLLKYALRMSTGLRKQAWQKLHPFKLWNPNVDYTGVRCRPVVVIIDEGIAIESAGTRSSKEENRWFLSFLFSLRHNHIALLYAIQNSNARSWLILEQATTIRVFRIKHMWALDAMRAAGASPPELEQIRTQGRYQYVELSSLDVKTLEKSSGKVVPGADESD